ncbi:hypothetical protein CYY_007383 [Polysphondylium violaceum]|uniref:MACPF domain-containing protein n=1 Tax=Polysphondylium violaceum TaxID=133409 RepID=A0A8J4V4Y0_9MYCE|nr:hypothetical protein CYY_007383 [Polysphondylium violaceum]
MGSKIYLFLAILIVFIGCSYSSDILKYGTDYGIPSYLLGFSQTGCSGMTINVVINEPKLIKTIINDNEHVNSFSYSFKKIVGAKNLIQLSMGTTYAFNGTIPRIIVENNDGLQFVHTLANTPLICTKFNLDTFARAKFSSFELSHSIPSITFYVITDLKEFQSSLTCTTNIGGTCYISQLSTSHEEFSSSFEARPVLFSLETIEYTITNIFGESFVKSFNNPYYSPNDLGITLVNKTIFNTNFVFGDVTYNSKITTFDLTGPKAMVGFTIGSQTMGIVTPLDGKKNSRKAMISNIPTTPGGSVVVYGPNTLDAFQLDVDISNSPTKPQWSVSNQFIIDNAVGVPIQKLVVSDVSISEAFSVKSYSGFYDHIPYPYGFKRSATPDNKYTYTTETLQPPSYTSSFYIGGNRNKSSVSTSNISPSFGASDTSSPVLDIVSKKYITDDLVIFTLHIIDSSSGVFKIRSNNPVTQDFYAIDCLVRGNLNDGLFEIPLNLSSSDLNGATPSFYVYDLYNRLTLTDSSTSINFELDQSLLITTKPYISINDITHFEFIHNSFDDSINIFRSSLFLNISNADKSLKPAFYWIDPNHKLQLGYKTFIGYYDEGIKMFRIDFEIPKMSAFVNLLYFVRIQPTSFSFLSLEAKFGKSALITFDKTDFDNSPPMITQVELIKGDKVLVQPNNVVEIGYRFTIVDRPAGFASGKVSIISDYDGEARVLNLDSNSRISGNKFEGVYEIKFIVPSNSRNQTFMISDVVLTDENDKNSYYPPTYSTLSPFLQLQHQNLNINVEFVNAVFETTLPTLQTFSVVKISKNVFKFTLSIQDAESGISIRHNPYVFVKGFQSLFKKVSTYRVSPNNYEAIVSLDYPLIYHGCLFSVYGITDNHLNINGYSSLDLKEKGFTYFYKMSDLQDEPIAPEIQSSSSITQQGGSITLNGQRFAPEISKLLVNGVEHPITSMASTIIVFNMEPISVPFTVKVSGDGEAFSNEITITPITFTNPNFIYVEPGSSCTQECGSFEKPYPSIKTALTSLTGFKTIVLKDGTYSGEENTNIDVASKTFLEITSLNGFSKSKVDCKNYSYFMKIFGTKQFIFNDITIENCVGNKGGAFYIQDSFGSFRNVHFLGNRATNGAGVYSHHSDLTFVNNLFDSNTVWHDGASIYSYLSKIYIQGELSTFTKNVNFDVAHPLEKDFLCKNSTFTIGDEVKVEDHSFQCLSGCSSSYSQRPLCQDYDGISPSTKCGDGICDESESCLTCPKECSCHIGGLILETFKPGCDVSQNVLKKCESLKNSTLSSSTVENFMGGIKGIVVRIFGYIKVESSKEVPFIFQGGHFGLLFKVNGQLELTFNQVTRFNETKKVYLSNEYSHFVEMILFSNNPDGSQRLFKLLPFEDPQIKLFYSNLICGDELYNQGEKDKLLSDDTENKFYCPYDSKYPTYNNEIVCGDGICNEEPNSCYQDCYKEMTKTCPTRKVPDGHISPGFYFSGDTLGDMISNQFIWRLPGSEHLSFGVNIVTGEESASPLFQFDYCSNVASNVIEDPYRGNVYHIPPEFHGKAYPQCTYSTSTESYSSAQEISAKMQESSSSSYSASAGGGSFVSGSASIAYSKEKSTSEARKMSKSQKETIFKTDLICKSSYIEMNDKKISLHPSLLTEFSHVRDESDMLGLVRKHGTHYYKKTYLGGKLTQFTITSESKVTSENKDEWTESASGSFSASVSSPTFSISGSSSISVDRSQSEEQQQEKSESSTTSRMLIYGGISAAFSPAEDGMSSPGFKEWAQSIDVLPVPVEYQLYPIRDLLDQNWVNKHGVNLLSTWKTAEILFYVENQYNYQKSAGYSLFFKLKPFDTQTKVSYSLPRLNIKYFIKDTTNPLGNLVEKYFTTELVYSHTNVDGTKGVYTYGNNPDSSFTTNQIYVSYPSEGAGQYWYQKDYDMESNTLYPIKFDFDGPDFFSSVEKPEISLSNAQIDGDFPAKIINWQSNTAILFNKDGVFNDAAKVHGESAFEVMWSSGLNTNYKSGSLVYNKDKFRWLCSSSFSCEDTVRFRFPDGEYSEYHHKYMYPSDINVQYDQQPHHWHSFSLVKPKENTKVFQVEVGGLISLGARVNWIKLFYPKEKVTWECDIFAYHVKEDSLKNDPTFNWINGDYNRNTNVKKFSLVPIQESQPKQLFFYKNYNYRKSAMHRTYFERPYHWAITNSSVTPTFVEDGVKYNY